jgi:hypothetical protein
MLIAYMTFHPKALLATAAFVAAVVLAVDFRLGLTTCVLAVIAYVAIDANGMGFGYGFLTGRRRSR